MAAAWFYVYITKPLAMVVLIILTLLVVIFLLLLIAILGLSLKSHISNWNKELFRTFGFSFSLKKFH